jgi:undecaprenyl-diphosphatase
VACGSSAAPALAQDGASEPAAQGPAAASEPMPEGATSVEPARTKSRVISPLQAVVLGVVEGITEFLPVSSTGHLVLADDWLGLRDPSKLSAEELDAVEAYEIVIQLGAILAVLLLYQAQVREMLLGLIGRSPDGRRLAINVVIAFLPAAVVGLAAQKVIKSYLQFSGPVVLALLVGGVGMIAFERTAWAKRARAGGRGLASITPKQAVVIGCWQCLALWPGTSRSMVTIVGGMATGLAAGAAAEFSFLVGLITLAAASGYKGLKHAHVLLDHIGLTSMAIGLVVAAVFAALAVKWLVSFLNRRGLSLFGHYRIVVAACMWAALGLTAR